MGFNDESETDYLDSVKLCTDLVWRHGTVRHFNTNRENWKTVYVSEYQVKQEEAPPQGQAHHRPAGEQHIPFVILFILVYGRFMMIIQVNSVQWTRVLCMAAAWLCGS